MKKYLILADGNSPHTLKWIKELKHYFDIYLISFNGIAENLYLFLDKNKIFDLKINISVTGNNLSIIKLLPKVLNIIDYINPDFINAHYITSYGTIGALAKIFSKNKAKLILSAWGSDILVTPFKNKLYYYLTKFVLSKANLVTSDSNYMADFIQKIGECNNLLVFPFGIDRMPDVKKEEKDYNYFFSNRALEPNYNIKLVIDIFKNLYTQNNNLKLIVANDGTERNFLEKYVTDSKLTSAVEFVGYLSAEEMSVYYRKCGYYFTLPTSDSTSVSLLEAMAYGCIPIVSDIPANLEWIRNGKNGIIYSENYKEIKYLNEAYDINRNFIQKKALWSNCIKGYTNKLNKDC